MRRLSSYNYGFDNPIRFIDPYGMAPTDDYYRVGNMLVAIERNDSKTDNFYSISRGRVTLIEPRDRGTMPFGKLIGTAPRVVYKYSLDDIDDANDVFAHPDLKNFIKATLTRRI